MTEWLGKMLEDPPATSPPTSRRGQGDPAPAEPSTVAEMYNARFEVIKHPKWREQLLDRPHHRRNTATDVAEMVLALEEDELSTMLAFPKPDGTELYVASAESGVWSLVESKDLHEVYHALAVLTERLDRLVIQACRKLLQRLKAASSGTLTIPGFGPEAISDAMRDAEDHLRDLVKLFESLRTPAFASGVVKRIVTMRVMATKDASIHPSSLDTAKGCIAFTDGVYDFQQRRLLRGAAARERYQTLTVRYPYGDVMTSAEGEEELSATLESSGGPISPADYAGYERFMQQLFSSVPEVRTYLMDLLASSVLNENRQVIVFHHNIKGSNGKSTFFELIRHATGDLFMKCQSTVLNPATITSPSAPNEELISMKSRRIVMIAEPSSQLKLSASTIQELTGGDEQSTRANYGKTQTFVFNGMLHVLCNKIPEFNDMDGGTARRPRCVPYGSSFVTDPCNVDPSRHSYLVDTTVSRHFPRWRILLMREIMSAATSRLDRQAAGLPSDQPPAVVMSATRELVERDDTIGAFVTRRMFKTGEAHDVVSLMELYDEYKDFCKQEDATVDKKKYFKLMISPEIGEMEPRLNNLRNFWRGWRIKSETSGGEAGPEGALGDF